MGQPFFSRLNVVLQDLPPYSGAGQTPFLTAPALIVSDPIFLLVTDLVEAGCRAGFGVHGHSLHLSHAASMCPD